MTNEIIKLPDAPLALVTFDPSILAGQVRASTIGMYKKVQRIPCFCWQLDPRLGSVDVSAVGCCVGQRRAIPQYDQSHGLQRAHRDEVGSPARAWQ